MSMQYPIIVVTGSSGAGTSIVKRACEHLCRRNNIQPAIISGDSFHRFDRNEMMTEVATAAAEQRILSHFGPAGNRFDLLEELFKTYSSSGRGQYRCYLHTYDESIRYNSRCGTHLMPGQFTPWEELPAATDLLFYQGLHGLVVTPQHNIAQYVDLGIGVVPIINLEWIQKIHRDNMERGYSAEAVVDTIVRRMPDYIRYITPQFSLTDINFQRVPTVDTSNPFIARDVPTPDESFVIIGFRDPVRLQIDFSYLLAMIPQSFMSRRHTLVVPGGKMELAMDLILQPIIERLMDGRRV